MSAGFRSPLYLLGIAAAGAVAAAGFVSPVAPWLGGAAAAPISSGPGFTSAVAPWLGGASAVPYTAPPVVPPPVSSGGGGGMSFYPDSLERPRAPHAARIHRDDQEILEILAMILPHL